MTPRKPGVELALLRELRGVVCQCKGVKVKDQSFCRRCYGRLPRKVQIALYKRLGDGYEAAYADAKAFLEANPS